MTNPLHRLHPDGAPGEAEVAARKLWGDADYEFAQEHQRRLANVTFLAADAAYRRQLVLVNLVRAATCCLLTLTGVATVLLLVVALPP